MKNFWVDLSFITARKSENSIHRKSENCWIIFSVDSAHVTSASTFLLLWWYSSRWNMFVILHTPPSLSKSFFIHPLTMCHYGIRNFTWTCSSSHHESWKRVQPSPTSERKFFEFYLKGRILKMNVLFIFILWFQKAASERSKSLSTLHSSQHTAGWELKWANAASNLLNFHLFLLRFQVR